MAVESVRQLGPFEYKKGTEKMEKSYESIGEQLGWVSNDFQMKK